MNEGLTESQVTLNFLYRVDSSASRVAKRKDGSLFRRLAAASLMEGAAGGLGAVFLFFHIWGGGGCSSNS